MGKSLNQLRRTRRRGLLLLVSFGIVLPGAILGALNFASLEGDRLAREKLLEERHRSVAENIAIRLEETVEGIHQEVETRLSGLPLKRAEAIPLLLEDLDAALEGMPPIESFFIVSTETWEMVYPEPASRPPGEPDDLGVLRARLSKARLVGDLRQQASELLDLYARAIHLEGGHSAGVLRQDVARSMEDLLGKVGAGRLEEEAARFLSLEFQDRYVNEICEQVRESLSGDQIRPIPWETAAEQGTPILYGIFPLPGGRPPFLLGYVFDQDWLTGEVLAGLLTAYGEEGMRVGIHDQDGTRLGGVPAGDFLPARLSMGMGLPRWTIEVGGDREAFEQRHRTRKIFLLGMISFLALAIFTGALLTLRGVTREMEAARQKSDFVASVSHELRTPLTSIRMFAEMIQSGRAPSEEKQVEYARIISRESERLGALIDNVLDFSRLEEGRTALEKTSTPMGEFVRTTVEQFRDHLLEEGYPLEISVDDDLPPLDVDAEALGRAIQNLLGNAVKYAREDLRISVRATRREGEVRIEVEDHGPGIPPREQDRIFEKFYRGQDPGQTGCGLGLAIVRAILEGHGGTVGVSSTVGQGSTFTLALPIPAGSSAAGPV